MSRSQPPVAILPPMGAKRSRGTCHGTERRAALAVLDAVLLGAVVLGAIAVRTPDLMLVPRLSDETDEVLLGLRIARGETLPLVGVNTYIGALFNYVVAVAFVVLGPRPEAGRLTVLFLGAIGVIPTYLLGRSLGGPGARGRAVGLLAALLLACSATHIVVTSRFAYSNSLTPMFTTAGLWLVHRAVKCRSGPALAGSGLLLGLALQTHASAIVIWPGLAVYLLIHRRRLRVRWLLPAAGLGVLAVGNLLLFNLVRDGATFAEILFRSGDYGGATSTGLGEWPSRLGTLVRACLLALGGRVSEYGEPEAVLAPQVLLYAGLAFGGLLLLVRRREWLPLLTILSGLLVISLMNGRIEPIIPRARHYAQLLPLGMILTALSLATLQDQLRRFSGQALSYTGLLATTGVLLVASQLELHAYLADRLSRPEKNNLALLQAVDAVTRDGKPDERVYLDNRLMAVRLISGGRILSHVQYILLVRNQEYETLDVDRSPLPVGRRGVPSRRLVLDPKSLAVAATRYRLVPLPGEPGEGAMIRAFRAYPLNPTAPPDAIGPATGVEDDRGINDSEG